MNDEEDVSRTGDERTAQSNAPPPPEPYSSTNIARNTEVFRNTRQETLTENAQPSHSPAATANAATSATASTAQGSRVPAGRGLRRQSKDEKEESNRSSTSGSKCVSIPGAQHVSANQQATNRGLRRSGSELQAKQEEQAQRRSSSNSNTEVTKVGVTLSPTVASRPHQVPGFRGLRRSSEELEAKQQVRHLTSTESNKSNLTTTAVSVPGAQQVSVARGLRRSVQEVETKEQARRRSSKDSAGGNVSTAVMAAVASTNVLEARIRRKSRRDSSSPSRNDEVDAETGQWRTTREGDETAEIGTLNDWHETVVERPLLESAEQAISDGNHIVPPSRFGAANGDLLLEHRRPAGLVEARPVTERSSLQVVSQAEAVELDPQDLERKQRKQIKEQQYLKIGGIMVLVACLVLVVTLGVTLGGQETEPPQTLAPSFASTSSNPTSAPTTVLDRFALGLPNFTQQSLLDPSSAQYRAFEWLLNYPDFALLSEGRQKQVFALATFYYAMAGPEWPEAIRDNWMDYEQHECNW